MDDFSKKADEMLKKFMLVTNTVVSQIQGVTSSIVSMQEMNEKWKQKRKTSSIISTKDLRIWKDKSWTWTKNTSTEVKTTKKKHVDENQGKTVITGFHSETTESEVTQLLRGTDKRNRNGLRKCKNCFHRKTDHSCFHSLHERWRERDKFIRSANMLKKLRGRKEKITRSMDAEERFHNKRMGYVKYCIHTRHNIPLSLISLNWTSKHVSVKGQIVVKTCQSGSLKFSKYQDVEDEVEEQMQKWQTKNSSQRLWAVVRRG